MCLIFGTLFYVFAFSKTDFSFAQLGQALTDVGRADLWSFDSVEPMALANRFITGLVGVLVAQIYWQRCFACKDRRTARNGLLYSGIIATVMTMLTAFVGLIIMTLNQDLDANTAMPWFMLNQVPKAIAAGIFVLILAAGMSSADSCLNSAAVLLVNDVVRTVDPDRDDSKLVKDARIWTVVIGITASVCAIYASSIISLFSRAYSMAGAGLAPLLIIGLIWRKNSGGSRMSIHNSRVTPWGARTGIITGAVLSQIPALGTNATIIGLVASAAVIIIVSSVTGESNGPKGAVTPNI